jgi:hypothetical protein
MDESADRQGGRHVGVARCAFEKALLARCANCDLSMRRAVAEREEILCNSQIAHINCTTLLSMLRERATFALKLAPAGRGITHAASMKLECGGLRGLEESLGDVEPDVHRLLLSAAERFGGLANLPWPGIVRAVMDWQLRRRSNGNVRR